MGTNQCTDLNILIMKLFVLTSISNIKLIKYTHTRTYEKKIYEN